MPRPRGQLDNIAPGQFATALLAALATTQPPLPRPDSHRLEKLAALASLQLYWNRRMRFFGHATLASFVQDILLDSLHLAAALETALAAAPGPFTRCADVGGGNGVPGLILALAMPRPFQLTVAEPMAKRRSFVATAAASLHLDSVTAAALRLGPEGWLAPHEDAPRPFDAAISRAVLAPPAWLAAATHIVRPGGLIAAQVNGPEPPPAAPGTRLVHAQNYTLAPGAPPRTTALFASAAP